MMSTLSRPTLWETPSGQRPTVALIMMEASLSSRLFQMGGISSQDGQGPSEQAGMMSTSSRPMQEETPSGQRPMVALIMMKATLSSRPRMGGSSSQDGHPPS